MLELDQGEAAAIALALELDNKQILIDERDGRLKAKALNLHPASILGVLLRAKRDGYIDSSYKIDLGVAKAVLWRSFFHSQCRPGGTVALP